MDNEEYSPLHVASNEGHTAIIVALVEEGGADVNFRGGERKDTPLMLSVRKNLNILCLNSLSTPFIFTSLPLNPTQSPPLSPPLPHRLVVGTEKLPST